MYYSFYSIRQKLTPNLEAKVKLLTTYTTLFILIRYVTKIIK